MRRLALLVAPVLVVLTVTDAQAAAPKLREKGVNVYWYDDGAEDDVVRLLADRQFGYLKSLRANAVAINFPLFTGGRTSSKIGPGPRTPTADRLAILLEEAARFRLRVTLRPLLDEAVFKKKGWRGSIQPASRAAWFAGYEKALRPYLDVAWEHDVADFAIGVELTSLQGDSRWKGLAAGRGSGRAPRSPSRPTGTSTSRPSRSGCRSTGSPQTPISR
jgi:hypothetical protein